MIPKIHPAVWIVPAVAGAQAAPGASGGLFGQSSSPFGASSSGGLFGGANTGGAAGLGRSQSFRSVECRIYCGV